MGEFVAVLISFASIPLLTRKKVSIGTAIWICAFILTIISGLGIFTFFEVMLQTITDINRIKQYIIIIQIGILGVLLKKYNFIDEIVDSLMKVVKNIRVILMFIPLLIGLLVVPGGAIISAPFIDKIGEDYNIPKTNRGVINLIYRHISMHIMPYSNGLLIVALLVPQISIYSVIRLNLIFVTIYCILGYFLYIRKVEKTKIESTEPVLPNFIRLLKYTSPIYIAVFLNLLFGLPFYIGLLANFVAVYILNPSKEFLKDIVDGFNPKVLLSIVGVYLIQNTINRMDYLNSFLLQIFSNNDTIMIGIIVSSLFFGITTGLSYSSLGVILPILTQLSISHNQLILFTHFAFAWGFIGYFFSPLHLCQLFTCEYLGIKTSDLYKEYSRFIVYLFLTLIALYFVLTYLIG
ncbi:MAG: DUF401 family protein [Tissierella sp.]|nr:DUF401 family protein [Tissierella sp.]